MAAQPPMGYNSWNDMECEPNEKGLEAIALRIRQVGLDRLGYKYVVVDDCWMETKRGPSGELVAARDSFPGGMGQLGKFLHDRGLKFGIYTDRGESTCAGRPSSRGLEKLHARQFADWGVDFLKNDGCNDPECGVAMAGFPHSGTCPRSGRLEAVKKYATMARALNRSGRQIMQAICGWQPWFAPVGRHIGHMWRVTGDVREWADVFEATQVMARLREYHGQHGWNDPDMLIGSSEGAKLVLTPSQSRAQFSLWCVMSAPLMIGANVQHISEFDLETYGNEDAIRVNQDVSKDPSGRVVLNTCPPYPVFHLGLGPDLAPEFNVSSTSGGVALDPPRAPRTAGKVLCGGHYMPTCEQCPMGNGAAWCHGDCTWRDATSTCVYETERPPLQDRSGPWALAQFKAKEQHQCQIVWSKMLSNGRVALAAVNFASVRKAFSLPLADLKLPWAGPAQGLDLWSKRTQSFDREIGFDLGADGGHALWELSCDPAAARQQRPGLATARRLVTPSRAAMLLEEGRDAQ